ncbi:MAG: acyl-CoA dehydrogenase family protein [Dehalococcoidia bacterium]|nr:acyl-CoA dehydrogenase family protein [Dehalococcoidia bacterium]
MDFRLTIEEKLIQKAAREFAKTEIEPIADKIEREKKVPREIVYKMGKAGLLGMPLPRKYGGGDSGYLNWVLALEQMHYPVSASSSFMNMCGMVGLGIVKFGTEEQKERFLRPMCTGETVGSWAFTEPSTGSDPKSLVTRAERDGDFWVINGIKRFNTKGDLDGPAVVFANIDGVKTTAFIVDKNQEGYINSKPYELMGNLGTETMDTRFINVRVHRSRLLGEVGKGFNILLAAAAVGRLGLSIKSVAMAQAALDEGVKYAKQRTRRGVPIGFMQAIQWLLAEAAVRVEGSRWMTYRTASLKDQGSDILKESSMIKLFTTRMAKEAVDMSMQIHGSYGFIRDFKIERIYRAVKENELIEGSSEVQRSIIAGHLMN